MSIGKRRKGIAFVCLFLMAFSVGYFIRLRLTEPSLTGTSTKTELKPETEVRPTEDIAGGNRKPDSPGIQDPIVVETDPQSLLEAMNEIAQFPDRGSQLTAIKELLVSLRPDTLQNWLEALDGITNQRLRFTACGKFYRKLRTFDESAALDYLRNADQSLQGLLLSLTFRDFTYANPMEAWAWLDNLQSSPQIWKRGREQIVHPWALKDFAGASAYLLAMPEPMRLWQDSVYLTHVPLSRGGPEAAIEWFEEVRQTHPERSIEILNALTHMWSNKAPDEAFRWLLELEGAPPRLLDLTARRWIWTDSEGMESFLQQYADQEEGALARSVYLKVQALDLSNEDPQKAVAWIEALPGLSDRKALLIQTAQRWNLKDPVAVDHWLDGQDFSLDEVQSVLRFTEEDLRRERDLAEGRIGYAIGFGDYQYP